MGKKWDKLSISAAFLAPILGWRAERRFQQMPVLAVPERGCAGVGPRETAVREQLPSLSIIIPARNEAPNLPRLLSSLCALDYPGFWEVILVDDNSADDTVTTAEAFGVRIVSLDTLEPGWLGKPNACHHGAVAAQGEWLLFTDADTKHSPGGPAAAVRYVVENGLDGLTCHLEHRIEGWWDGLTLAAAYGGLFAGLPQNHRALNGQYILLHREVYERSRGFAAVRREVMEDLALGHHLAKLGYRVPMLRGEEAAEVAMYSSSRQMWRGMARIGAGSLRWTGLGSVFTALFVTALMTPLLALRLVLSGGLTPRWLWLSWAAAVAGIWPWSKRFGVQRYAFLAPFGAMIVQASAVWGLLNRLVGRGLPWKGRAV